MPVGRAGSRTSGVRHDSAPSSGWAGAGAADYARQSRRAPLGRHLRSSGGIALKDNGRAEFDPARVTAAVQDEVLPYTKNYFRTGERLTGALEQLDTLWTDLRQAGPSSSANVVKAREAAAMLATSRWMYRSALARTESRGMARREDFATLDPAQRHHLISRGLDEIEVTAISAADRAPQEMAA